MLELLPKPAAEPQVKRGRPLHRRFDDLTLDNPRLSQKHEDGTPVRPCTYHEIVHLLRLERGRGISWADFQVLAAQDRFPTYVDESRRAPIRKTCKNPNRPQFVLVWCWGEVLAHFRGAVRLKVWKVS